MQTKTKTGANILGSSTAFDTQKKFLSIVKDDISSSVDLTSAIKWYQVVFRYARSKVHVVFEVDLYMTHVTCFYECVTGYNNEIIMATQNRTLGLNTTVNTAIVPPSVAEKDL